MMDAELNEIVFAVTVLALVVMFGWVVYRVGK